MVSFVCSSLNKAVMNTFWGLADFNLFSFMQPSLIQSRNLDITAMGTCVLRVSECVFTFRSNISPSIRSSIKGYTLLIFTLDKYVMPIK